MRPLSGDTPLEVEEVWLNLIRERGPQDHIHLRGLYGDDEMARKVAALRVEQGF